jgi:hypothetical protein
VGGVGLGAELFGELFGALGVGVADGDDLGGSGAFVLDGGAAVGDAAPSGTDDGDSHVVIS